jgi:hypothetical protein
MACTRDSRLSFALVTLFIASTSLTLAAAPSPGNGAPSADPVSAAEVTTDKAKSGELEEDGLPGKITVDEVRALLEGARITSQGCGGSHWDGKSWGYYNSSYEPIKLPWSKLKQRVSAGSVVGGEPREHHLIEFSGPGFRYRRPDSKPVLLRVKQPE